MSTFSETWRFELHFHEILLGMFPRRSPKQPARLNNNIVLLFIVSVIPTAVGFKIRNNSMRTSPSALCANKVIIVIIVTIMVSNSYTNWYLKKK